MHHDVPLPRHVPEQIALYQSDHLLMHEVCRFDPDQAVRELHESREVLAVDIGGDKIRRATYSIHNGRLIKLDEDILQSRNGAGYLSFLERVAEEAIARNLRVGISSATKLIGSIVTRTVNLPVFYDELEQKYDADYENLFPERSFVANDTVTGICGSSAHLALQGMNARDVGFFICASGLGASVIKDGMAIHVEIGHVPLMDCLNPLGQTTPCGVDGRDYVCVERVTAARAGIEDLYLQQTGVARDGLTLGQMYEQGDELSTLLYDTSALALAHATAGIMERYAFAGSKESALVFHGGNFEIEKYRRAVRRNLGNIPRARAQVIFSRDLSDNVCLDGAAILAVRDAP